MKTWLPPPKFRALPPVETAAAVLRGRAVCRIRGRSHEWTLDGRPSDPRHVVRAANRILARIGWPRILYPGGDVT